MLPLSKYYSFFGVSFAFLLNIKNSVHKKLPSTKESEAYEGVFIIGSVLRDALLTLAMSRYEDERIDALIDAYKTILLIPEEVYIEFLDDISEQNSSRLLSNVLNSIQENESIEIMEEERNLVEEIREVDHYSDLSLQDIVKQRVEEFIQKVDDLTQVAQNPNTDLRYFLQTGEEIESGEADSFIEDIRDYLMQDKQSIIENFLTKETLSLLQEKECDDETFVTILADKLEKKFLQKMYKEGDHKSVHATVTMVEH